MLFSEETFPKRNSSYFNYSSHFSYFLDNKKKELILEKEWTSKGNYLLKLAAPLQEIFL